ncbi:MAG: hypothetical protein SFW67_17930 [Myxococcaceae bacterium]|nr:hypothetical protein [Myxococcaceae bacterium]
MRPFLFLVPLTLLLDACGCPPVPCRNEIVITLVDETGAPATPSSGVIDGQPFACAQRGGGVDAGLTLAAPVTCGASTLTISGTAGPVDLEVTDTRGRRALGRVTPTFPGASPVAPVGCQCAGRVGEAVVTVRP